MSNNRTFKTTDLLALKETLLGSWEKAFGVVVLSSGELFSLNGEEHDVYCTPHVSWYKSNNDLEPMSVEEFKSLLKDADIVSITDGGVPQEECDVFVEF